MIDAIENVMRKLPPPAERRDPNIACLLGFLFGGIGLAIYLRTAIDLFLPLGIGLLLVAIYPGGMSWLAGAVLAAVYGYFRVKIANEAVAAEAP